MTFLAPMVGLIGAALAAPVLLAFYMLKLRRRPVRVSSIMLWAASSEDTQANVPLRRPRPTWLLAMQAAILALLLLALARPAVHGSGPAGDRAVLLIDRSASMSATDAPAPAGASGLVSRWELALRRADETIRELTRSGRTRVMLAGFARDARIIVPFTDRADDLLAGLRSLSPSDQPDDPDAAAALIEAMTRGGEDVPSLPPPTVVLITDSQTPELAASARRRGSPIDLRVLSIGPPPRADRENIGITALSARRDPVDRGTVRLFVRLGNASNGPRDALVRAVADGSIVAAREVRVPGRREEDRGDASVRLEFSRPEPGLVTVSLSAADALACDDTAAVWINSARRPSIMLVAPSGPDGRPRPDPFLARAVGVTEPESLALVTPDGYAAAWADRDARRAPPADVVIFDRVEPRAPPPVSSLSFGAGVPALGVGIEPGDDGPDAPAARALAWRRDHPLLAHVSLDELVVFPGATLRHAPQPASGARLLSLADGANGPLIGLIEDGAARRVFIAFDLERTNWGPDLSFPVFLINAIDYLSAASRPRAAGADPDATWSASDGRSYTTTEPVTVRVPPGVTQLRLEGPEPRVVDAPLPDPAPPEAGAPDRGVSLGVFDRVGVWRAVGATDEVLPVNLFSVRESWLRAGEPGPPADAPTTADRVSPDGPSGGPDVSDGPRVRGEVSRELWHWFVAAAMALLALEWLLFARRMSA
ncbi:MAG: VWA domain-containing protein [Phycisphaerae bacterium]|nr:VWA domain-containing protein [Phycisphaerae bacterium]